MTKIRTNLKACREMNKLSQAELAKKLGISSSALSQMEKEGIKSTKTAEKIARYLGVNPVILLELGG